MAEFTPSEIAIRRLEEFLSQNGLGAELMDAGSMAGMASAGFSPFFGTASRAQSNNFRGQEMIRRVNEESERSRAISTFMAGQAKTVNEEARRTATQLLGLAWNSPTVSPWVGGSDIDLAFGLQNATMASGFRLGGARLFGAGPVSDQLTHDLWSQADKFFFEGGHNQLRRTSGFDRTQVGQIFSLLGQRGAFAGAGTDAPISYDRETGRYKLGDTSNLAQTINQKVSDITEPLRMLQDIVGPKPMGELVSLAESLSGISAGAKNAKQQITQTLMEATTNAAAFGLNPHTYLNFQGTVMQGLGQLGFGASTAAGYSRYITPQSIYAANNSQALSQQSSFFLPTVTKEQAAAGLSVQMSAAQQDPKLQAYMFGLLMQQNGLGSAADRRELERLYTTGTPDENRLMQIYERVNAASGGNVQDKIRKMGGYNAVENLLSPGSRQKLVGVSGHTLARRGTHESLIANLESVADLVGATVGTGQTRDSIELHSWLAANLETSNYEKLAQLANDGGLTAAAVQEIFGQDRGAREADETVRRRMQEKILRLSNFGGMHGVVRTMQAVDDRRPNRQSLGDRLGVQEQLARGFSIYDDMTPTDPTLLGGILRGLLNQETTTDEQVMQFVQMRRASRVLTERGGAHPGAEQMQAWTDAAVSQRGLWEGLGQFNLDLLKNGTAEQKAAQEAVVRAIYTDAYGDKNPRETGRLVAGALARLRGSAEDANDEYRALLTVGRGAGGYTSEVAGRRGVFDYLRASDKEKLTSAHSRSRTNFATLTVMQHLGILSDEEKNEFNAAVENPSDVKPLTSEQLDRTVKGLLAAKNFEDFQPDWERLMKEPDARERYTPVLTTLRSAVLDELKQDKAHKFYADGKLTDEGKDVRNRADRLTAMLDSATGNTMTGRLTISNFGEAIINYMNSRSDAGSSAEKTK